MRTASPFKNQQKQALALLAVCALLPLGLAGCAAEKSPGDVASDTGSSSGSAAADAADGDAQSGDAPDSPSSNAAGTATLEVGDVTFTATLSACSLYDEGDALFHGSVHDDGNDMIGYLDGDFTGLNDQPEGEVRIDLGASKQLESTDRFVAMGTAKGNLAVTNFEANNLIVMGDTWDEEGTMRGVSTLRVQCE